MKLLGCCILLAAAWATGAIARDFTVSDSIAMRRILSIDGQPAGATFALYSPDEKHFVVRARRGDIENDQNIDELMLFKTKDVLASLRPDGVAVQVPVQVLAERRFRDDWAEISHVRWISDREVGFVAPADNGRMQAFAVDVDSRTVSQLTHSATDVASFAASRERVVYYARQPTALTDASVISVDGHALTEILARTEPSGDSRANLAELFVASRSGGTPQRVSLPAGRIFRDEIWISPAGDQALILTPAVDAPAHWSEYRVWDNEHRGWTADFVRSDPGSYNLFDRHRFAVVDLQAKTARPLFDAPDGELSATRTPAAVFWLDGGRRLVVSHTYLPLREANISKEERERRVSGPAIAEVSPSGDRSRAIVWEPFLTVKEWHAGKRRDEIVAVSADPERDLLMVKRERPDRSIVSETWVRSSDSWRLAASRAGDLPSIELRQGLNERPRVHAVGGKCGCSRIIYDPAPQTDQFTFGRAEAFSWTDSRANEWQGALIYPVDYVSGRRYPLVLQTHGYSNREFLIDGPSGATTAFAAQALANAGFVVLQAGDNRAAITADAAEGKNVADGWKRAIDKLVAMAMVDPSRVGIIGFSRTGFHVVAMLSEFPDAVAAATISDSVQYGYSQYLLSTNFDFGVGAGEFDRITGGSPFSVGYGSWFESNLLYRMSRSAAALRIEAIGEGSLLSLWETYALRVRTGKPADLVYFPKGSHVLMKPSERNASQGGNVDWFRFWLQDYEDPAPAKTQQYRRWRELRSLRK